MWTLKVLSPALWPLSSFSRNVGVAGHRRRKSAASRGAARCRSSRRPAGILPGQRTRSGTRKAPSQFVFFSLRNIVMPASGHEFMCGPLSVEYMTKVLSVMPSSSR